MQGPIIPRHTLGVAASSLSSNLKNFVYFSTETRGVVGKAVKIDSSLFGAFLSLVDPTTYTGQQVVRAIINLRSTLLGSNTHAYNAFEHLLTVGSVAIRYRVTSEGGEGKEAIYVTQVRSNYKSKDKAGFYAVSFIRERATPKEYESNLFSQDTVYISGVSDESDATLADAAIKAAGKFNRGSGMLIYSNGQVINDLGIWNQNSISGSQKKQLTARVREALELNADQKKEWVVEGEGAALLLEAIANATGDSRKSLSYEKYKFSNYTFKILNPVCDTSKLLSALRQKNAQIRENVLGYNDPSRASRVSAMSQYSMVTQKLSTLGARTEFNQAITQRFRQDVSGSMAKFNSGRMEASGGGNFIDFVRRSNRALK